MSYYPSLYGLVRPYQAELVTAFRRERTWLCTSDMGTGKSRSALLAPLVETGILVVCPAGTRGLEREPGHPVGGWLAEAGRVRPDLKRTRLEGDGKCIMTPAVVAELQAAMAPPTGPVLSEQDAEARRKAMARARSRLRANEKRQETAFRWPESGELCVASYETMRTAPMLSPPTHPVAVFFDEAQALKNPASAQARAADRVVASVLSAGGRAFGLTGTPLTKDPEDLKTIYSILRLYLRAFPGGDADFGRIFRRELRTQVFGKPRCRACGSALEDEVREHCGQAVRKPKTVRSWVYGQPLPEAVDRMRRVSLGFMLDDVTDLPEVVEVEHAVELDAGALQALGELGKLSDAELLSAIERERVASDPDSHVARARAALAAAKRAVVGDVIDEIVSAGERVVFFADHRIPVEEVVDARHGWGGVMGQRAWVHGGPDMPRESVIDKMARGELDGFAATLGAGGTGVDGLQRSARHLVLLEESWSPSLVKQAVGRLRRIGQKGTVVLHKLVTGHPVEDRVHAVVETKMVYLNVVDEARRSPPVFGSLF